MPRGSSSSGGSAKKKPATSKSSSSTEGRGEIQRQKSPAEFFADNQAIAGFDNYGKSLYTSIRELMENSLDACESIGVLPTIQVYIEELNQNEFNKIRGISADAKDTELFEVKGGKATSAAAAGGSAKKRKSTGGNANNSGAPSSATKLRKKATQEGYFQLRVRDNGCGMKHDKIPDLLGRVLSGSKYGVRQTRGKFGLGAKMALIWSKKSTGVPIKITTAHLLLPKSKSKANNIDTSSLEPPKKSLLVRFGH